MNIFYPEYLTLVIVIVIILWKVFRDDSGSDVEKRERGPGTKKTRPGPGINNKH